MSGFLRSFCITSEMIFVDEKNDWDRIENWFYYYLGLVLSEQLVLLLMSDWKRVFIGIKKNFSQWCGKWCGKFGNYVRIWVRPVLEVSQSFESLVERGLSKFIWDLKWYSCCLAVEPVLVWEFWVYIFS